MPINPYIADYKEKFGLTSVPMMPASGVLIENDQGEVLLQKRTDNGHWCLPGGSCDAGDQFLETAVRETYEETGLVVQAEDLSLFALLSDPDLEKVQYPDGSFTHYYSAWFCTNRFTGEMIESNEETAALKFYAMDHLPDAKDIMPSTQFLLYTAYPEYKKNKTVTVR